MVSIYLTLIKRNRESIFPVWFPLKHRELWLGTLSFTETALNELISADRLQLNCMVLFYSECYFTRNVNASSEWKLTFKLVGRRSLQHGEICVSKFTNSPVNSKPTAASCWAVHLCALLVCIYYFCPSSTEVYFYMLVFFVHAPISTLPPEQPSPLWLFCSRTQGSFPTPVLVLQCKQDRTQGIKCSWSVFVSNH